MVAINVNDDIARLDAVRLIGAASVLRPPVRMSTIIGEIESRVRWRPARLSARVVSVLEFVVAHLATFTNSDLETTLALSPYYVSRLFRLETGQSLKAYVTRVRIQTAKYLLEETTDKIETIAERVGLADSSHLSRMFLKYSGVRPGAYRRGSCPG